MKTLVISSNNEKELILLQYLAKKMGMKANVLSEDEKEELGLINAMLEGKKGDYVNESEVLKALEE